MTSSCLLGVHHAMFAKTAGNEIEAIGSWDEVKWLAASGWRRLTTWSRSICHLKSHPWNLKWLEKFKKFSAWDNFWGVDEMKCCSTYSSVPLYQLTWKSWPPQQHPLFAPPLLLCSFAHWFLCFWGNKGELSITISSCSGHVQAHRQIPLQLWRFWTLFNVQFFHICQVWLLFELPLSFIGSLDEFVALKVNFGVLCGERNILNYFI